MAKRSLGAITALIPLPAVMVSCRKPDEKPNIITISWTGIVCSEPPMISVSIRKIRHSYDIIKSTGEFVVNLTNHNLARAADICGNYTGAEYDKFELAGLTPVEASKVTVPMIAECPINMECQVRSRLELGSHDIFIAEIVEVHADESVLVDGRIDIEKLDPLVYCTKARQYWSGLSRYEGRYGYTIEKPD